MQDYILELWVVLWPFEEPLTWLTMKWRCAVCGVEPVTVSMSRFVRIRQSNYTIYDTIEEFNVESKAEYTA